MSGENLDPAILAGEFIIPAVCGGTIVSWCALEVKTGPDILLK
jgi:hypothetical protein